MKAEPRIVASVAEAKLIAALAEKEKGAGISACASCFTTERLTQQPEQEPQHSGEPQQEVCAALAAPAKPRASNITNKTARSIFMEVLLFGRRLLWTGKLQPERRPRLMQGFSTRAEDES